MGSYPMEGSVSGVAGWCFTTYYNMLQKFGGCCGGWAMCGIMRDMKNMSVSRKIAILLVVFASMVGVSFAEDASATLSTAAVSPIMPAVTRDATFVVGANLDRNQILRVVDCFVERMLRMMAADEQTAEDVRRIVDAWRDPFANIPTESSEFLSECGLNGVYPEWALMSVEGLLSLNDDSPNLGGMALAILAPIDLDRVISVVCRKMAEADEDDIAFREIYIDGEKAWRILPNRNSVARDFREVNVNPHIASIDGRLVIVAMSRRILEKQIRLYRNGEGAREGDGDALGGFSAADGQLMRIYMSGIGDTIRCNVPVEAMKRGLSVGMAADIASVSEEIVTSLRSLALDVDVAQDGGVRLTLRLEAGSEDDGELIRTLVGAGLALAKTFGLRTMNMPRELASVVRGMHVGGLGSMVEFRCDDAAFVLGGIVLPQVSLVLNDAIASSRAMRGRNIFVGIIQANTEREVHGFENVWPRTVALEGEGYKDDIAGKAYTTSTEYFRDMFDAENYGTQDWAPYLDCDISVFGRNFDDWCVAANVTDDMPDCIPVLVSANFNPELLRRKWDRRSGSIVRLPIGSRSGAAKSMFGDREIVVVRKGGSVEVLKERDLTYAALYRNCAFCLPETETPLVYLTPKGIAVPQ